MPTDKLEPLPKYVAEMDSLLENLDDDSYRDEIIARWAMAKEDLNRRAPAPAASDGGLSYLDFDALGRACMDSIIEGGMVTADAIEPRVLVWNGNAPEQIGEALRRLAEHQWDTSLARIASMSSPAPSLTPSVAREVCAAHCDYLWRHGGQGYGCGLMFSAAIRALPDEAFNVSRPDAAEGR